MVERVAEVERFAGAPTGRFTAGATWIHFCANERLWGVVLFGEPSRFDAEQMIRSFAVQIAPPVPRHQSFVDARALGHIDDVTFAVLHQFARENLHRTAQKVQRLALVLPAGIPGAVVAGFYNALGAPFPVELFGGAPDALAWLGEAEVASEIAQAVGEARGLPP